MANTFFQDLLASVTGRGRGVSDLWRGSGPQTHEPIVALSEALISNRGEASGMALAREIVGRYGALPLDERRAYLIALAARFGIAAEPVEAAVKAYRDAPTPETARTLHEAAEPQRQELFRRLNMAPGGTRALVTMRENLLAALPDSPELAQVDHDFRHLLGSWFNRGFLVMRQIDWQTPAAILEKIIRHEAVHEIADWDDLRRRIDLPDRRLYAFFHPALADDPLIFVEVALCEAMPEAIAPLLSPDRKPVDPAKATTAAFYSISNCQPGLKGISFGNFLIKQVAEELAKEWPNLTTFVTLSPVPGFRRWLEGEGAALVGATEAKLLAELDAGRAPTDPAARKALDDAVLPLAAHYFLRAKNARGRPPDPVARFHLGNGARLERINAMGDPSAKGLAQGAGLMVNYAYVLKDIEQNHEAYAKDRRVVAASSVQRWLKKGPSAEARETKEAGHG